MAQRSLRTFQEPIKPELDIKINNDNVCMISDDFSKLTVYAIELGGQLQKCNAQAKEFN